MSNKIVVSKSDEYILLGIKQAKEGKNKGFAPSFNDEMLIKTHEVIDKIYHGKYNKNEIVVLPASVAFKFIFPINLHGSSAYVGITNNYDKFIGAVVDKETGVPLSTFKGKTYGPDVFKKIINKHDEDKFTEKVVYKYASALMGFHLSIVEYLYQKKKLRKIIDVNPLSNVSTCIWRSTCEKGGNFDYLVEKDMFYSGDILMSDLIRLAENLTIDQVFSVLDKYTSSFMLLPYEMNGRVKSVLYTVLSHEGFYNGEIIDFSQYIGNINKSDYGYMYKRNNKAIVENNFRYILFDHYAGGMDSGTDRSIDTMLFLYIVAFLKLAGFVKEYNEYISLADEKGLESISLGKIATYIPRLDIFLPISEKRLTPAYFYGSRFFMSKAIQPVSYIKVHLSEVKRKSSYKIVQTSNVFLEGFNIPVYVLRDRTKLKNFDNLTTFVNIFMRNADDIKKALRRKQKLLVNLPKANEEAI